MQVSRANIDKVLIKQKLNKIVFIMSIMLNTHKNDAKTSIITSNYMKLKNALSSICNILL